MTKHTRNPEARKAEIAALHQRMAEQVAQLATSEGWRSWVEMAGRLHHYSFRNILLIKSQNRGATRVAGFRAWQEMGRQVRKGGHGIRIMGGSSCRAASKGRPAPRSAWSRSPRE